MPINERNIKRVLRFKDGGLSAKEALKVISDRDDAAKTTLEDVEEVFRNPPKKKAEKAVKKAKKTIKKISKRLR